MGDIITQQCAFYKLGLNSTKFNLYGEASDEKYYEGPILVNCLVERKPQDVTSNDYNIDVTWDTLFKILRDDLLPNSLDFNSTSSHGANIYPEIGDIILYQENYFEISKIESNQFFMGKDPDYPNSPNPINPGLEDFGYNVSVICTTHMVPPNRLGISKVNNLI